MRKIKYTIVSPKSRNFILHQLLISTVMCLFFGINNSYAQTTTALDTKSLLIGTWVLNYPKTAAYVNTSVKTLYDQATTEKKNRIETSLSQRKLSFLSDGTLIIEVNSETKVRATWSLNDKQRTLSITLPNKNTLLQKIESINTKNMLLNLGQTDSSMNLFNKWYLDKQTK